MVESSSIDFDINSIANGLTEAEFQVFCLWVERKIIAKRIPYMIGSHSDIDPDKEFRVPDFLRMFETQTKNRYESLLVTMNNDMILAGRARIYSPILTDLIIRTENHMSYGSQA